MRKKLSFYLALVAVGFGLGLAFLGPPALGQSSVRERPELKNFGSSLERFGRESKKGAKGAPAETKLKKDREGWADEEEVVRVETSLVVCDFLVLDEQGRQVRGLTQDDFDVAEDDRPQQVGTFALGDNAAMPRSIVLIIDYSGSQFPFIRTSVDAAKTLVDKLNPRDMMAIVTDDVELLVGFTGDKEKLKNNLEALAKKALEGNPSGPRRFGRSAQYSALMATLNEAFGGEDLRPVVIFQTDGDEAELLKDPIISPSVPPNLPPDVQKEQQKMIARMQRYQRDNVRKFSLDDVYKAAEKSRATIYTIVPGHRLIGLTPEQQLEQLKAHREKSLSAWVKPGEREKARARLEEYFKKMPVEASRHLAEQAFKVQSALAGVAEVTGGWTEFLEDPSQAEEIYSRILSDINRRYVLGYYPANKERDGRRREVKIGVRGHPEYTVLGRKSYYAPGPEE